MNPVYKDSRKPINERVADLLSRMTLKEKLAQMRMLNLRDASEYMTGDRLNFDFFDKHRETCGAIFNVVGLTVSQLNEIRKWYIENTRLGIPIAVHSEGIHGAFNYNATIFPSPVAMAASFDRRLYSKVADKIGEQLKRIGTDTVYAPNLDISRDPRWGRVEEHYGEDPYLTAEFGTIYVKEVQKYGVASCIKHFAVHSAPEGGLNLAPVHEGRREIESVLLYPFKKVIENANPKSVMPAYSEIDGEPLHLSQRWLRKILREQLGFNGFSVSDYGAMWMSEGMHFAAHNKEETAVRALKAGVDLEAPDMYAYDENLEKKILSGEVDESLVDEAVSRLLTHKFDCGLFDNEYSETFCLNENTPKETANLALEMAQDSIVLLKNENNLLPLMKNFEKIALIGPNADVFVSGGYTGQSIIRTADNGLKQALENRFGKEKIIFAKGCGHTESETDDIESAVTAAKNADIAVVVLGDWSLGGGGVAGLSADMKRPNTCGEGYDVNSLCLPGKQQELLEAVVNTKTPVVLILESGRPYAISWAKGNVPAILQAWFAGEEGGEALTNILFGDVSPSAKLPISFPQSVGHIPCYYNRKHSSGGFYRQHGSVEKPGRDYVFSSPKNLYDFGHGLSYTEFEYKDLKITPESSESLPISVEVTVENIGKRAGKEAVLLFVSDVCATVTPYVKQLKAFDKIFLNPGESKTVKFSLDFDAFFMINEDYIPEAEQGEFIITVGEQSKSFYLKKSLLKPECKLEY